MSSNPAEVFRREVTKIRSAENLPGDFALNVLQAADAATKGATDRWRSVRVDLTDVAFVTLDPASSTDLDQAFSVVADGHQIVLNYALADIAAFAPSGGFVETEAWQRGVTVYLPESRIPVYPSALCERAASLLPDGPRPAIVVEVAVAPDGTSLLRSARRAVIASRAKLAYESTKLKDLSPLVLELHRRIVEAEHRRGAFKIDWPEQRVEIDTGSRNGVHLALRPMLDSEEANSSLSLAANMALATVMIEAKSGLFRVMPEPDEHREHALRRMANALGISWPDNVTLRSLMPSLDPTNLQHKKLLVEARKAGRGASYALYDATKPPWHSALAASYAHATAPMRRLADRYVLEHVLALTSGDSTVETLAALAQMPILMAKADGRASAADRAIIDLVEALEVEGRVGEEFDGLVLESGSGGLVVQVVEPPVRSRVRLGSIAVNPSAGEHVKVRLTAVDVEARSVTFELIQN